MILEHPREPWPDIARGFAIVTIVFFHVVLALDESGDVHGKIWTLIQLFAPVPIALFFFVSGIFSRRYIAGPWGEAVGSRIFGLLYVFVLWSILEELVRASIAGTFRHFDVVDYAINPFSTLWFVWALAVFTFVAKTFSLKLSSLLLALSGLVSALCFAGILKPESFVYQNVLKYAVVFFIGTKFPSVAHLSVLKSPALFVLGAAVYGVLIFYALGRVDGPVSDAVFAALMCIALPTAISGCYLVSKVPLISLSLSWLGQNSLGIYLGHPIVIMLLVQAHKSFTPVGVDPALVTTFVLTILTVILSVVLFILASGSKIGALYKPPKSVFDFFRRFVGRRKPVTTA